TPAGYPRALSRRASAQDFRSSTSRRGATVQDFPPASPQAFPPFAANESLSKRARVFQLASAVDAYELCMAQLMANWFDSRCYADAEAAIWEVRSHGVALPDFSVRALELCI